MHFEDKSQRPSLGRVFNGVKNQKNKKGTVTVLWVMGPSPSIHSPKSDACLFQRLGARTQWGGWAGREHLDPEDRRGRFREVSE